jgi:hypothetical protein
MALQMVRLSSTRRRDEKGVVRRKWGQQGQEHIVSLPWYRRSGSLMHAGLWSESAVTQIRVRGTRRKGWGGGVKLN